ncbi:hypothetical protein H4R18_002992 [Coemansia javaensis]|uniref:Major facilitator superfamily (MFS) profile domain-containing protein n=1 Tax=Coemansia javaensis TaxID=2761396 RepID=A0A9W8LI02_9FUNG|nr:hypothetical protein H4R18_002992 [Coemansia javaensis]
MTQQMAQTAQAAAGRRISRVVFVGLLLDILAFTVILPLLPRSLEAYKAREGADPATLLGRVLGAIAAQRARLQAASASRFLRLGERADLVLLGGLLGSLYSLLQCLVAPAIGRAADRFGRRRTLMACMAGNLAWTVMWVFAGSFETFLAARVVAGLSEGNVQLSNTIIADVTDPAARSHGMALVGIAFAVGFTLGPSIGAYFARLLPLEPASAAYAPFAAAALFSLALLVAESLYLYINLPETLGYNNGSSSNRAPAAAEAKKPPKTARPPVLRRLNALHFAYLFFFSGMEYTLTFLTHDRFGFSNAQQGRLLGFIGVVSTLLQGGWVRRAKGRSAHRDRGLVATGMAACAAGLLCVALCCCGPATATTAASDGALQAAPPSPPLLLWAGALGFAVASATVVNCLNSMVSLVCTAADTGSRLGDFRSAGQVGRALGPLFACSVYWLLGPATCYFVGAAAIALVALSFAVLVPAAAAAAAAVSAAVSAAAGSAEKKVQ